MGLLDQAHSFAQGASNGVASSLTGPVDGLAWLLRKAGVPVPQAPLGGSDWMRNVGLMQEPKERMAGLLGEGIGSALPTVIAGKAPQIAGGLLQMERNAMAPRTLNPQTGAIVWHGSPHKFDKFDSSKIGTGEGAQAYGHGLYLADSQDAAKFYADKLTEGAHVTYNGKKVGGVQANLDDPFSHATNQISTSIMAGKDAASAKRDYIKGWEAEIERASKFFAENPNPQYHAARQATLAKQKQLISTASTLSEDLFNVVKPESSLYQVDLPDEHIAKMLDWDKPLSQQSNEVQKALTALKDENGYDALQSLKTGYGANFQGATGQDILRALERNTSVTNGRPEVASSFLKKQGIPGIRYLDGGSRTGGAGTSNYVVFPGNEGLLKILERNGQGLPGN